MRCATLFALAAAASTAAAAPVAAVHTPLDEGLRVAEAGAGSADNETSAKGLENKTEAHLEGRGDDNGGKVHAVSKTHYNLLPPLSFAHPPVVDLLCTRVEKPTMWEENQN